MDSCSKPSMTVLELTQLLQKLTKHDQSYVLNTINALLYAQHLCGVDPENKKAKVSETIMGEENVKTNNFSS